MKNVLLIVNPVAGKLKSHTSLIDVISELQKGGMCVTVRITEKRGDAAKFAEEADPAVFDVVACFGGDGTLNETISGVIKSGNHISIGYIPAGSTNDFAQSMKLPNDPKLAANIIANGAPHKIDIGLFNNKRNFSYVAAFGIFTATSYNVPQQVKNVWGHTAYILGGVKEIGNIKSYHVRIKLDDREIEGDYIFGAVANSTSIAGIVKLKEDLVDFNDGFFEVGLIKTPKTLVELNNIVHALTTQTYGQGVEIYKAANITFYSEGFDWTLDGKKANGSKEVKIECMKSAIDFIK